MFGRILLIFTTVASLLWLGYATYDRVNQSKQFSPEYLFGKADENLLIIFNEEQKDLLLEQFPFQDDLKNIVNHLNFQEIEKIYLSQKRNHLFIEAKFALTDKNIKKLITSSSDLTLKGKKDFQLGGMKGSFTKNYVYLTSKSYDHNTDPWTELHYDENSDGTIINFQPKEPTVTDIYIKDKGVIEYKMASNNVAKINKVNDRDVFSVAVPSRIESYTFYETDYLRFSEPKIYESPINNWLNNGLVLVTMNGNKAIISDYLDGQEPIQVMYDFYKKESTDAENDFFPNAQIPSLLGGNGIYIYKMDDFVVLSNNRATCEAIVGDYRLGNTLAQHPQKSEGIFSLLPQNVNHRVVEGAKKQATSLYNGIQLSTVVGSKEALPTTTSKPETVSTKSFVASATIRDIHFISPQSFFITTADKKVMYFDESGKKWEKELENEIIGSPAIIDILANQKSQLLVSTSKKIHVLDVNGNEYGSFPIAIDQSTVVAPATLYRWKGAGYFLVPVSNGRIMQYDNQGRELHLIRTKLNSIDIEPTVWVSANKPYIGVLGDEKFEMIQADTRKSFRIFNAGGAEQVIKLPNEVKLVGILKNQFIAFNQKGGISYHEKFSAAKLQATANPDKGMIVRDQQHIKLLNSSGQVWGSIKLPFSDVADVQILHLANGSTIVGAVDALENKVYLFKTNGELYRKQTIDGSKLVRVQGNYLFTMVDNLIVRHAI